MSKLSEDLIFEILTWLPATILSRFRFVSKSWFNLITTSSCFAQSQLDRGSKIDNPRIFAYNLHGVPSTMEFKEQNNKNTPLSPPSIVKTMVLPMKNINRRSMIMHPLCVGSCNGWICLNVDPECLVRSSKYQSIDIDDNYYLWNPSTNEFKDIPLPPVNNIPPRYRNLFSYKGFGYDRSLVDYKIISITTFVKSDVDDDDDSADKLVVYRLYTLGTNSWRNIAPHGWDKFKLYQATGLRGIEVNGSLHWIGRIWTHPEGYCLISLGIANESARELPAPPGFNGMFWPTLTALKDCLCVIQSPQDRTCVEVWMMEDYGVKESWVKLFSTTHPELTKHGCISNLLWICKNGEILVDIEPIYKGTYSMVCRFALYNPKINEVKILDWPSLHNHIGGVNVYFESLVRLKSGEIVQSTKCLHLLKRKRI